MTSLALSFNNINLTPVNHNNQIWLTSVELAKCLGYASSDSVSKIFDRNKEEFNDDMSIILRDGQIDGLGESSGLQREQRIFSSRGCHLVGMFSRTAIAKEFRKWVLDILDHQTKPQPGLKELPPSLYISESEATQFKKSIEAYCKSDSKSYAVLYRKTYDHYGITTYKNIPANKLEEAARLLGMKLLPLKKSAIPAEPFTLSFTPEQLEDLVAERIKSVSGEVMPKQVISEDTITISLNGGTRVINVIFNGKNDNPTQDYLVRVHQDHLALRELNDNEQVKTQEQFIMLCPQNLAVQGGDVRMLLTFFAHKIYSNSVVKVLNLYQR